MSLQPEKPVNRSSQSKHILCAGVPSLPGSHTGVRTHTQTHTRPCTCIPLQAQQGAGAECARSLELLFRVSVSLTLPQLWSQTAEEEGKAERPREVWRHQPSLPAAPILNAQTDKCKHTARLHLALILTGGTSRFISTLSFCKRCVPGQKLKGAKHV